MSLAVFLAASFAALYSRAAAAWRWGVARQPEIVGTAVVLIALLRAVPPERWSSLEHDWPRLANLARLFRALFPDLVKAARALSAVWTGRRWPEGAAALDDRRGGEVVR